MCMVNRSDITAPAAGRADGGWVLGVREEREHGQGGTSARAAAGRTVRTGPTPPREGDTSP